jgi:hypothetical protein
MVDAAGAPLPPPAGGLASRPLHLIGHSRGAVVNSDAVRRLAAAGIGVDHVTTMDPHPVNGTLDEPFFNFDWGDAVPQKWTNVTWADNYWRADGGGFDAFDFDGIPIPGVHDTQLDEDALECCAYAFSHSDVHLWYHGTIDTSPAPCDGEECITPTMRLTWWPRGWTQRGYHYARLGGGSADRPAQAPGADPGTVPLVAGGTFEQASRAGWLYHGGALQGAIVSEGGLEYLRLGAGSGPMARHNRFHLPAGARAIRFDYRIITADTGAGDDQLSLRMTNLDSLSVTLEPPLPLGPPAAGWVTGHEIVIPAAVTRGRTHTMTFQVDSGAALVAVVGVDNIDIVAGPPGDIDGDGAVGIGDLLALLGAWGPCPPGAPPPPCPADLDGDGTVDIVDLLLLLGNWG